MLTTFFRKSKPINFLMVGVFMAIYYILINFIRVQAEVSWDYFFKKVGLLGVYIFLMLVVNFIVKRNEVTRQNTFTIALFAVFTVSFPSILEQANVLISGLFLLLALRRIMSLRSQLEVTKKIFDASLWISVATLFYPPVFLFIIILFCGILVYAPQDFRHWLIPLTAIFTVLILKTAFDLWAAHTFFNPIDLFKVPQFDFSLYGASSILFPLSILLAFSVWTVISYINALQKATLKLKTASYLILFTWVISMIVVILSPTKNGAELLFYIFPICVIGANYFQRKSEKVFKEILLVALFIGALVLPFFA